jgi:methionyl-tRNA formyltransferase
MMAACEKIMIEQEDTETVFFANIMQFQAQRLQHMVDKFMAEQIRAIEATKLTVKKRKGVTIFIRHFPVSW